VRPSSNGFLTTISACFPRLPGLTLAALLAAASLGLAQIPWFASHGVSALTLAIALGIVCGNTLYADVAPQCAPGIDFAKRELLRIGVILYGFRLTFEDIRHLGLAGILVDLVMVGSTLCIAWLVGIRFIKLDHKLALLIGTGSAICGAAAVIATEPILKARPEQVTVAVATVVIFGTVGTFLYPAMYPLPWIRHLLPGGDVEFGRYVGSTIHEVAQVVAAGRSISPRAADAAVIAKMVRVMLLGPFLLLLSLMMSGANHERAYGNTATSSAFRTIPWFALAFVGAVLVNSIYRLPASIATPMTSFDTYLLAMAMGSLGLTTHASSLRRAGTQPLLLALILFVWLVVGGIAISRLFFAL
jgi:uncharacterized integral membrane protein (TIGR00698 family)